MFSSLFKIFWKLHKFVHIKKLSAGLYRGHISLLPFLFQFRALEVVSVYSLHSSSTLASWCEKLTHWKRPWCWERLKVGGEGDDRGWEGWVASLTWWLWVWARSETWWWTRKSGVLQSMGSQRVRHDWATELNWILELGLDLSSSPGIKPTSPAVKA